MALQQFHHDVRLPILLTDLMNRADVGMVQCRGSPRLALESFQRLAVFSQFFLKTCGSLPSAEVSSF
jgi:hypothetical protein